MIRDTRNIVLITFQYSVVMSGISNKLKQLGYQVDVVSDNYKALTKDFVSKKALFMVYLPNDIMDDSGKRDILSQISELVIKGGCNLVIVGEKQYRDELFRVLPEMKGFGWVDRPIDMDNLSIVIDRATNPLQNEHSKKRILIVDDDASYAKMVKEWLRDIYKVDIVTAGATALSFLLKAKEGEQADLILLDYEMPVLNGPQVLQMLRNEPTIKDIPVLFLTGMGTKEAVESVMALKPDGYILKSSTSEDLLQYLYKQLHKR